MFAQRQKTVDWFLAVAFGFLAGIVSAETIKTELIQQITVNPYQRPLVPSQRPESSPQADYCEPYKVFDLSWSSDGTLLAVGVEAGKVTKDCPLSGVAQIYNITTTPPELLYTLSPGTKVESVAFNNAGTLLAVGGLGQYVRIYDAARNFDLLYTLDTGWASRIVFSNDDTRMAVAGRGEKVHVYGIPSLSTPVYTPGVLCILNTVSTWDVDFNSDGDLLAVTSFSVVNKVKVYEVKVYDLSSPRTPLYTLSDAKDLIGSVVFNPDNTLLLSSGNEGIIRVYDMARLDQPPQTFNYSKHSVLSLDFNRNGTILVAGGGGREIHLYDISRTVIRPVTQIDIGGSAIRVVFDHRGDRLAAGGFDGKVRIYSLSRDGVN